MPDLLQGKTVLYIDNDPLTFVQHRLKLADAASQAGLKVHVAVPPGQAVATIREAGYEVHTVPMTRLGINPFREARTVASLVALCRQVNPDLIHALRLKPVVYGGIAARLLRLNRVVGMLTGLGRIFAYDSLRSLLLRFPVVLALAASTRRKGHRTIFENSDDMRELASRRAVDAGKSVVVNGSGVDLSEFRRVPEPDGPIVVMLAARLVREKGVEDFAEAGRILRKAGVAARFVLVGNPDHADDAIPESQIQAWVSEGVVEHWGFRADMPAVLAQCHVACLPSRSREGVPRFLIEAASVGRALVATAVPGCREIVRPGVNGLLVPPANPAVLAEALTRVITDHDQRRAWAQASRLLAETSFSQERVFSDIFSVYRDLMLLSR